MVCLLRLDDGEEVSLVYARLEVSTFIVHLGFVSEISDMQADYVFLIFTMLKRIVL